jgi:hypothetical protein
MKTVLATVLCVAMAASTASSDQKAPANCNGNCPLVAPPQVQSVPAPIKVVQGAVKAPVRVIQQVRTAKPVRGFLRRLFSR